MEPYILWGDIAKRVWEMYHDEHKTASFYQAFLDVRDQAVREGEVVYPDFSSWDCQDAGDFYRLACACPRKDCPALCSNIRTAGSPTR